MWFNFVKFSDLSCLSICLHDLKNLIHKPRKIMVVYNIDYTLFVDYQFMKVNVSCSLLIPLKIDQTVLKRLYFMCVYA